MEIYRKTGKKKNPTCGKYKHNFYVSACYEQEITIAGNSKTYIVHRLCCYCPVNKQETSKHYIEPQQSETV